MRAPWCSLHCVVSTVGGRCGLSQTPRPASSVVVLALFIPPSPGVPTSFRDLLVGDLGTVIIPVSGMVLIVVQLLTTPLVTATSPSQGRRWRNLYPLKPGCWSTPKGKGSPELQFPFRDYLNLARLRGPTLWAGWGQWQGP